MAAKHLSCLVMPVVVLLLLLLLRLLLLSILLFHFTGCFFFRKNYASPFNYLFARSALIYRPPRLLPKRFAPGPPCCAPRPCPALTWWYARFFLSFDHFFMRVFNDDGFLFFLFCLWWWVCRPFFVIFFTWVFCMTGWGISRRSTSSPKPFLSFLGV